MNKKTIIKALNAVISKKTSLPILENVCLSKEYLSVTDLETHLSIPYKSDVDVCVPIDQFISVLETMENPSFTVIESKDEKDKVTISVEISSGQRNIKVMGENASDFPICHIEYSQAPDFFNVGHIDSEELKDMEEALAFTSSDQLRPNITGVYIAKDIVATDARLLFWKPLKNFDEELILSKKTIKTMLVFGGSWQVYCGIDYYIIEGDKKKEPEIKSKWGAVLNDQGVLITFRPIDAKFPDYKVIIPNETHTASLEITPATLIKEMDTALKFCNKSTNMGVFTLNGCVQLFSSDIDYKHEYKAVFDKDKVKHEGELTIGFNMKYLDKIASHIQKKEKMNFKFWSPNRCTIINDRYLLMPLMIHE